MKHHHQITLPTSKNHECCEYIYCYTVHIYTYYLNLKYDIIYLLTVFFIKLNL